LTKWGLIFDLSVKEREVKKLEKEMSQGSFWSDQEKAQEVTKRVKELKDTIGEFNELKDNLEELAILLELNLEEDRKEIWEEIEQKAKVLEKDIEKKELIVLFDGKYDTNNAIVTIRPGAGGTESQDWAEMLLRMYLRWAEKNGYIAKIIEISPGEEAGIKNVTFTISGNHTFGYLKAEKGIHRLVRISPFDANRRRHTSFASVEVIPEIDQEVEIEIKESDLRIDTYRATGAGGQHVNTTDSQYSNKITAMKILRARLFENYQQEKEKDLKEVRGKMKDIAWGNQIRSYVFHPYQMVKDHRTEVESGNLQAIMDGEINCFIEAYLKSKKKD
jgi:peptide chain release factor 2